MKILLTGASGYLGQAFLKELGHKYSIRVIGRKSVEGNLEFVKGDIRIYDNVLNAANGVDIIVHLAAFAPEVKKEARNQDFFDSNIKGTFNILQAAVDAKVKKIIYASSICAVGYEGLELPVKENARPNPSDGMYGLSKYFGEQLCQSYTKWYGITTLCLRLATVVPKHEIIFPLDPNTPNWFGYVDIRDVVQALDLAVETTNVKHGVFHICAENAFAKYDITEAKKRLGFNPAHNYEEFFIAKNKNAAGHEKKINIAIEGRILHRNISGSERYISELIKNIPDIERESGYNYFLVNNSRTDLLNITAIPSVSSDRKIDLYHRTYQFATHEELSELLNAGKSVFTFLDLILCKYPDYFMCRQDYENNVALMELSLNLSSRIIAISEHAKRDVVETFDIPAEKVDVVHLGFDFNKFKKISDAKKIAEFRKEYGLPEKYILYLGTDYPHKNMKNLLIAFAMVADREEMKDYRLVWAGNSYYAKGKQYFKEYIEPIKDKFVSLGHFDDEKVALLYNAADIFVFPSLYEGFGLPVLEAFACEVPLICSNATSLPEVAGDAAYMVNAIEPDQIAAAIVDIVNDSRLRESLIQKGRERAKEFTWEKCARNTYEVYKKTLSQTDVFNPERVLCAEKFINEYIKKRATALESLPVPVIKLKSVDRALLKKFVQNVRYEGFLKSTGKAINYIFKK